MCKIFQNAILVNCAFVFLSEHGTLNAISLYTSFLNSRKFREFHLKLLQLCTEEFVRGNNLIGLHHYM